MKKKILIILLCVVLVFAFATGLIMIKRGYTIDYVITRLYAKIEARLSNRQIEIVNEPERQVVNEWTKGYSVALPFDMEVDTDHYQEYITAKNDSLTVVVTREWAPYEDVLWYIENYQNQYILHD